MVADGYAFLIAFKTAALAASVAGVPAMVTVVLATLKSRPATPLSDAASVVKVVPPRAGAPGTMLSESTTETLVPYAVCAAFTSAAFAAASGTVPDRVRTLVSALRETPKDAAVETEADALGFAADGVCVGLADSVGRTPRPRAASNAGTTMRAAIHGTPRRGRR